MVHQLLVRWDHLRFPRLNQRGGKYRKIDALLEATGHMPNYVLDHVVLEPWLLWQRLFERSHCKKYGCYLGSCSTALPLKEHYTG